MSGTQELKEDLKFNGELTDLLEVMKSVAVFQYRSLLKKRERFLDMAKLLSGFFGLLDANKTPHRFIHPTTEKPLLVMVTSNEGFMGDLNFQVMDSALLRAGSQDVEFIVVGESGARYLKDAGKKHNSFKGAPNAEGRGVLARAIKQYITKGIREERFGRITIFYPNPISFFQQKVEAVELFPLTGFFSEREKKEIETGLILESPEEAIIEYLAEVFIENKLIEILEDSKLSEFSARAVHLGRGGQELVEKRKLLQRQYSHAMHELIDKNTRELFSSKLIIKHKAGDVAVSAVGV